MRFSLTLMLFCSVYIQLIGQNLSLSGILEDSLTSEKLEYASVTILDKADSTIIAYCYSDVQGYFKIEMEQPPPDSIYLSIAKLGYTRLLLATKLSALLENPRHTYKLNPQISLLNEVVVNANAPDVLLSKDTVEFRAKSFADGTERRLEDILRKIPGMEVSANGRIKYQNKEVERVLIEGEDILGSNYTIGTKNLSNKMVDKVQVIDNYTDNPLMKEILKSDVQVLNLKVSEEFKNEIAGSTDVGLGNRWKYIGGGNLLAIFPKAKSIVIGGINNVRLDVLGDISGSFESKATQPKMFGLSPHELNMLLQPSNANSIGLAEEFTIQGRQSVLSLNQSITLDNKTRLKITALTAYNAKQNEQSETSSFFSFQDTLQFSDRSQNNTKEIQNRIDIYADRVVVSKNYSISNQLSFYKNAYAYENRISRDNVNTIASLIRNSPSGLRNQFEFTRKTKNRKIIQVSSDFVWTQSSENGNYLNPNPPLKAILGENNTQNINQNLKSINLTLRYISNSKISHQLQVGTYLKAIDLQSNIDLPSGAVDIFSNNNCRDEKIIFINDNASTTLGRIALKMNTTISNYFITDDIQTVMKRRSLFAFSSELSLKCDMKHASSIELIASTTQKPTDVTLLSIHPIITDFQTVFKGNGALRNTNRQLVEIAYKKKNDYRGYFVSMAIGGNKMINHPTTMTNFRDDYFEQSIFFPKDIFSYYGRCNGSYIVSKIKSRLDFSLRATHSTNANILNEEVKPFETNSLQITMQYGTAFKVLNYRSKYSRVITNIKNNGVSTNANLTQTTANLWSTLIVSPAKSIQLELIHQWIQNRTTAVNSLQTFQLSMYYLPKNRLKDHSFELRCFNLFGTENYKNVIQSDYFSISNETIAVAPFGYFKWTYSF